jgi:hypothetical protein
MVGAVLIFLNAMYIFPEAIEPGSDSDHSKNIHSLVNILISAEFLSLSLQHVNSCPIAKSDPDSDRIEIALVRDS